MNGLNSAYVDSSGGTINNGGYAITVPQALLAPSGSGVSSTSGLTFGGANSGYIDAPVVVITGGAGSGATAVATVSGGQVTGIQITNPGNGYTSASHLHARGRGRLGDRRRLGRAGG